MEARQYNYSNTDIHNGNVDAYNRKQKRAKRKALKRYFIKQKFFGLLMVLFSILVPIICDGDATISLFILPMALYMIFTKEKVLML
jgi:hypothetical protein